MSDKNPCGNKTLWYLRASQGMSQREFSEMIGTDQPHICNVEAGRVRLGGDVALRVLDAFRVPMDALGITLEDLLRGEPAGPPL